MNHYSGSVPETMRAEDWRDAAACRTEDPEIFFAAEGKTGTAETVCRRCPSRTACLVDAYTRRDEWGVRGGLTHRARRHYLRKHDGDIDQAVADAIGDVRILLRRIYQMHAQPVDGGHVVWTDQRLQIQVRGKAYTVLQIAWWAVHGTAPTGSVTRTCTRDNCVAQQCLADLSMRKRAAAARKAAA